MAGVPQIAANVMHAAQAVHAAHQMPVATTVQGWTASTYFLAFLSLLGALGAGRWASSWIAARGGWRKTEIEADEKLRSEMWRDIEGLKASKQDMSRRLTMTEAKVASQTVQIGQLRFVSALVVDELERRDPGNSIARQARFLLEHIQPDALPSAEEIAPMADIMSKMCGDEEGDNGQP